MASYYGSDGYLSTLRCLLDDLQFLEGRYACEDKRRSVQPELYVSGVGKIATPLTQDVRQKLQQLCQYESLRTAGHLTQGTAWQLDSSLLAATNPDWEDAVCSLGQARSLELGVSSAESVKVVLQNVTLSDQCSSFTFGPQTDAPPGTFATMVVLLLAPYTVHSCCQGIAVFALESLFGLFFPVDRVNAVSLSHLHNISKPASAAGNEIFNLSGQPTQGQCRAPEKHHSFAYLCKLWSGLHCIPNRVQMYATAQRDQVLCVHGASPCPACRPACCDQGSRLGSGLVEGTHGHGNAMGTMPKAQLLSAAPQVNLLSCNLPRTAHVALHLQSRGISGLLLLHSSQYVNFVLCPGCSSSKQHVCPQLIKRDKVKWDLEVRPAHHQMASVLKEAERQGLIDVYLVKIIHREWLSVPQIRVGPGVYERGSDASLQHSETTITHWKSLDGREPGYAEEDIDLDKADFILQGARSLGDHDCDREKDDTDQDEMYDGAASDSNRDYHIGVQRWYTRAAFVIWHPQNRWPNFCKQGIEAATFNLTNMIDSYKALTAQHEPAAATADSQGNKPMSASQASQHTAWTAQHELAAATADSHDHEAMSASQLYQEQAEVAACWEDIVSLIQAMHQNFASKDLTSVEVPGYTTFGDIALAFDLPNVYEENLRDRLKGSELEPETAQQLVDATKAIGWSKVDPILTKLADSACCGSREYDVHHTLAAFQALGILLGVEGTAVLPAVTAIAVRLVHGLQHSLSERVFASYTLAKYSTKPWNSAPGLEKASCSLIDLCLTNPQHFYVTEVLGPACLEIAGAQANTATLAESPAAIKLMAGCVQQLRQAAQLQQTSMYEKCTCETCQVLQQFLVHSDQTQTLSLGARQKAQHAIKHLQPHADSRGHVIIQQQSMHSNQYQCTKELHADKLQRVQEATTMLTTMECLFSQVVVDLFLQGGQAPPEPMPQTEHKPEPQPQTPLYNLWQPM